jgi:hypothetical protein
MRDLGSLITELEAGEVDKLVLTQRNRMRAVVVSIERWSEVERALADGVQVQATDRPDLEPVEDQWVLPREGEANGSRAG